MTWFKQLTGMTEESPLAVRDQISIVGDCLVFPNGRRVSFGRFETPTLSRLRKLAADASLPSRKSTIREVVGDVRELHAEHPDALFQVASQFNLLEMACPSITPERGVGIYENDHTQGPACAIACGAGTIYRNYFVDVDGQTGQSAEKQIDCAAGIGSQLGNTAERLWKMENGYLFPTDHGLASVSTKLQVMAEEELNQLRGQLRIGLHWQADVTIADASHKVSQAYCSALPVAYGRQPQEEWTDFARLILDAAYESTFAAAVINAAQTGVNSVFLTLLGGGVFGNENDWITAAIERAFIIHRDHGLDVQIVSHHVSKPHIVDFMHRLDHNDYDSAQ